jgi:hypothetical protein
MAHPLAPGVGQTALPGKPWFVPNRHPPLLLGLV